MRAPLPFLAITCGLLLAPGAVALEIEGTEFALTRTGGDDPVAGETLQIEFQNAGSMDHGVYVALVDHGDPAHEDTPGDAALGSTGHVSAGSSDAFVVDVPDDATALYLWCDLGGHETVGMWLEVAVGAPSEARPDTTGGGDGDGSTEGAPGPAPVATVFLCGLLLAAGRRRAR